MVATWSSHMPGVPKGGYVSRIETSHKEEGTVYVTFDNHRSGDFAIYIYASKNYGDSLTKITNGIPPEAGTVHVIREDPANANLLFAGTEFGLFVTFNRGRTGQRMKNGLPTVPGVRPPDSSARSRSDSRHARPLHLDHGQHHGARRDGGTKQC